MEQITVLYVMKIFIMESIKKGIQDENCIFAASTEFLESQNKVFVNNL